MILLNRCFLPVGGVASGRVCSLVIIKNTLPEGDFFNVLCGPITFTLNSLYFDEFRVNF